jgi:rhamnosyltransferase
MKIAAVIVTYFPEIKSLQGLVQALLQSNVEVFVADNTPSGHPTPAGCIGIPMGGNVGIARAQNAGIALALRARANVILFFDQDSTIEAGFVELLVGRLDPTVPGMTGPVFFDQKHGLESPSETLNAIGYPRKVLAEGRSTPYPVDVRISSGTAVTAPTFAVVGDLDDSLFLDFVDIEWCLRARARGVPILVEPAAVMQHSIGQAVVKVGPLHVHIDRPVRGYYRIRNGLLLLRKRHVPKAYTARLIAAELVHQFLGILLADQRSARSGALISGIWHGLIGVSGPRS